MKSAVIISAFVLALQLNVKAQSIDGYPDSVNAKIKQVENNIYPMIQLEGDKPMTIQERMKFQGIIGLSVAVIHNYKIEWAKAYGWADDSLKVPASINTLFQAASISKSLNAIGVLKLAQDKKIDLYTDVNTYLTSWKFPYDSLSKGKKLTIANLLSHTGGITVHGFEGYTPGKPIPTIIQVLNGVAPANSNPIRSMYEPGLKSEYSGGGITISQLIIMDVTNQPYNEYMYNNVLKPLGMVSSTYNQPPIGIPSQLLATGYRVNGKPIPGKHNTYPEQAAAGLWTNPTDLAKYIIETQLAYAGKSKKVLNQQFTQLRLTPYIDKSAALGVFIDDWGGIKYFEHSGANEGFRSLYYGSIAGGNGVVIMVNSDNSNIMGEVVNSVAQVYGFKGLNRTKIRKAIVVTDAVLQSYTGEYQLAPGFTVTITRVGNQLIGKPTGQDEVTLFPETQTKFFLKVVDAEVEFVKDEKGVITKFLLYQNGIHEARKIK
jgi:CubicO group peptidase (beta-lactamase class C family)